MGSAPPESPENDATVEAAAADAAAAAGPIDRSAAPYSYSETCIGDERRCPKLRNIVDDRLAPAVTELLEQGLLPKKRAKREEQSGLPHGWDFVQAVCKLDPGTLQRLELVFNIDDGDGAGAGHSGELDVAEAHQALGAAVETVESFFAGVSSPAGAQAADAGLAMVVKDNKTQALVRLGLNRARLWSWFMLLALVSTGPAGGAWYDRQAFMRSKAVCLQLAYELAKLSPLGFRLAIEPVVLDV